MSQPSPMATPVPWNLVASAYAEEIVPMFEKYSNDALKLAELPEHSRIVDVACGPGTLSALAAARGHTVEALDFSSAMIERLESRKLANVTSRVGDGQALPYEAGTFAGGFSMFGLMFFPDRAKGFAELRRVLVPGARAVVSSWVPLEQVPVMAAMFGALRTTLSKILGPSAPQPGSADMPLATEELCRAEMSEAFRDVTVHRIAHAEPYTSADDLWASLTRTMAPIVLMKNSLGEKWAPLDEAARTAIRGAVGAGPGEMTMTALLGVGTAR